MSDVFVLCILANGFEEIEAVTVVDLLRRANIKVTIVGLDSLIITGSHGIKIQCESILSDTDEDNFTHVFLPGGQPGTNNLKKSNKILEIIRKFHRTSKGINAICAAPTVLYKAGVLKGRRITSYPAEKDLFVDSIYIEDDVVHDGNLVTSRGVGTAITFALYLVEHLTSKETSKKLAQQILYKSI